MSTHCRIGTVRPKNAPHLAELRPAVRGLEYRAEAQRHVDEIFDTCDRGCAGYVVVAWDFQGFYNTASRLHPDSFVGRTMLPGFVADILRRDTMAAVTRRVLNDEE